MFLKQNTTQYKNKLTTDTKNIKKNFKYYSDKNASYYLHNILE